MTEINRWEMLGKLGFSALTAGLSIYLDAILLPILLLVAVMAADYATGMAKAWIRSDICSRTGIVGIIKKLGYLMLVAAAMAVDWVVFSTCEVMGISFSLGIFGLTVTVWLIINEVISILENLSGIGVPLPEFFRKAVSRLKVNIESKSSDQ